MTPKNAYLGLLLLLSLAIPARADDGIRYFCRWELDGFFYQITIEKTENGRHLVRYPMDGTSEWVPEWRLGKLNVEVGERIEARWWKDKLFYKATVTQRSGDKISVRYDDGSTEDTTLSMIRLKLLNANGRQVGESVLGRWQAGTYWYTGKIQEIREGKYRITFDDGDEAWLTADDVLPYLPTFGDRVEAKWSGDGKFYTGRIARRNGHKVRIDFDDGTSEESSMRNLRVHADRLPFRTAK